MSAPTSVAGPHGSPGPAASGDLHTFLHKTSRTFALTIPLLPEPLRTEIGLAYLLFRIIDTFEDATNWPPAKRIDALNDFVRLIDQRPGPQTDDAVAGWVNDPPVNHQGYIDLLAATPRVLGWHAQLDAPARTQVGQHLKRCAQGMAEFVARTDGQGMLRLRTLEDLRGYCFVVAGIVGQMLTELFLLRGGDQLSGAAAELRSRSVRFGEGLQLVNILKDARTDSGEGRIYLPRDVLLAEVFVMARADLRAAAEYTELLRTWKAPRGIVAFNALNARLAISTLRLLRDRGFGSKLTRAQVLGLAADVSHALDVEAPLFEDARVDDSSAIG